MQDSQIGWCLGVRRRVERAQQMLNETDLPLSGIVFATGFSTTVISRGTSDASWAVKDV